MAKIAATITKSGIPTPMPTLASRDKAPRDVAAEVSLSEVIAEALAAAAVREAYSAGSAMVIVSKLVCKVEASLPSPCTE